MAFWLTKWYYSSLILKLWLIVVCLLVFASGSWENPRNHFPAGLHVLDEGYSWPSCGHSAQVHPLQLDGRVQALVSQSGDHLSHWNCRGEGEDERSAVWLFIRASYGKWRQEDIIPPSSLFSNVLSKRRFFLGNGM